MGRFQRLLGGYLVLLVLVLGIANVLCSITHQAAEKNYQIEINRMLQEQQSTGSFSVEQYPHITGVTPCDADDNWFLTDAAYVVRVIDGVSYRIDYLPDTPTDSSRVIWNAALLVTGVVGFLLLLWVHRAILKPFHTIYTLPESLAKGNLTVPLQETSKNRYFGKFLWGLDMLRQSLEDAKTQKLTQAKEEKRLLLSLSHDIKTPLSAIRLYAKALSSGLYAEREKQIEAAEHIQEKTTEIEGYLEKIMQNARKDFLQFDVKLQEFYLSDVMQRIHTYYADKAQALGTVFSCASYEDCLLSGDAERLEEVLQNILENALKYGDGVQIGITFSDEEDCRLITIENTGCTLPESELPHIFESFWRGSNADQQQGSGLGLYICRKLMHAMGGDVFAEIQQERMQITVVCRRA